MINMEKEGVRIHMEYRFEEIGESAKSEVMRLYRSAIGSLGCTWSSDYPSEETFYIDINNHNLFGMIDTDDSIIGLVSVDQDEEVDGLECWSKEHGKMGEIARLVVRADCQNKGIARQMINEVIDVLRSREYRSAHYLVSRNHIKAIAAYKKLDFTKVGEAYLYNEHWLCYEKFI